MARPSASNTCVPLVSHEQACAYSLLQVVKADKSAVLTHVVEVQDEKTNAWFEAFVDAASGELVSVTDFVAQATVSSTLTGNLLNRLILL
jgi:hypothetical protein